MKILLINHRYFISGGPETYMLNVKETLEHHGHEVIPYSIKSSQNIPSQYEEHFAEPIGGFDGSYFDQSKKSFKFIIETILRQFYSFKIKKHLKQYINEYKPDVVYVLHYYNKLSVSVIDAVKESGLPIFIRLSDFQLCCPQAHMLSHSKVCDDCITKGYFSCVRKKCIKNSYIGSLIKFSAILFHRRFLKIFNKVDKFICTNDFMKSKMEQSGFDSSKLTVVETPFVEDKTNYKFEKPTEKYILYFGRFVKEKGVDDLVKAYTISKLKDDNIKLILAGGTREEYLLEFENNLIDSVEFKGFLNKEELSKLIIGSLFVVLPSKWYENLPNSLIESYKYNKPVIGSNIGSIPEFIEENRTGLVFKTVDDLAEKMNILVKDEDLRIHMSNNIKVYKQRFSAEHHYQKLINIFQDKL